MANILIADDDHKMRDLLKRALGKYNLTVVENWEQVINHIGKNSYDLVVTDIIMPGYKELATTGPTMVFKDFPGFVIFISGYTEHRMTDLPDNMRFLSKPFSVRMLDSYVRTLLKSAKG